MVTKTFMEDLSKINCRFNHKIEENGLCYCQECMFNQDETIKKDIRENGCKCYMKMVDKDYWNYS